MSAVMIQGRTRGGAEWTPKYIETLDVSTCIGCGRCYKVCSRDVFELVSREDLVDEDDDADEFDSENAMVMVIKDAMDCIGCESCSKVCPKDCHTHSTAAAA